MEQVESVGYAGYVEQVDASKTTEKLPVYHSKRTDEKYYFREYYYFATSLLNAAQLIFFPAQATIN